MNSRSIILFLSFFLFLGIQVTILRNLTLFDVAFCFIYIGFILFLPIETNRLILLILAFIIGFVVDLFYDSIGIHAASAVLLAFIRPYWINVLTPQGGYDIGASPTLKQMNFFWFASFALPLILIHHISIFYIEGGSSLFFFTLVKVFASTIFTYVVLVLVQLLSRR